MTPDDQILLQSNVAFRFVVSINNIPTAAFTECTLPVVAWEVEEIKEGGLNSYVHQLPGRRKSAKLTLKNGVGTSSLMKWCIKSMTGKVERKTVTVALLDHGRDEIAVWRIDQAYPLTWTGPQLKSDTSAIAIQTLEFACGEITIET